MSPTVWKTAISLVLYVVACVVIFATTDLPVEVWLVLIASWALARLERGSSGGGDWWWGDGDA